MSAVLDKAIGRAAEGPGMAAVLDDAFGSEREALRKWREVISNMDAGVRENWSPIIALALHAGVTEEEMLLEIGASPSTLHRWVHGQVAPREGTRKMIKRAVLDVIDRNVECPVPALYAGQGQRR